MLRSALLSLVLFTPTFAAAQRLEPPPVGTRVRVTVVEPTRSRFIGVVASRTDDTLRLRTDRGDTIAVARAALQRVEVSGGRRGNALMGAGVGAVGGAVIGAAIGKATTEDGWFSAVGVMVGGGIGLGGGLILGAVIGSVVPSERWGAATGWELSLATPPSGQGLGLALRF